MSQFDRNLTGFRFVAVEQDDTLQEIAARELGDAGRWVDIVNINKLLPPYLTGDAAQANATVKLYGQMILVPAASPQASSGTDPNDVFKTDILLTNGRLTAANGDMVTVSGRLNLRQALINAIRTAKRELLYHLSYGCDVKKLLGTTNGPTAELVGASRVNGTLQADSRVQSASSTVTATGDVLQITADIMPVAGAPITITASV